MLNRSVANMIRNTQLLLRSTTNSTQIRSIKLHNPEALFEPSESLKDSIEKYSRFMPTPLTIHHFLEFGRKFSSESSFKFLQLELPVRLAGVIKELEFLPQELRNVSHFQTVESQYYESMRDLLEFERNSELGSQSSNEEVLNKFTECLKKIHDRHSSTVPTMAQAVFTVKQNHFKDSHSIKKLPKFEKNIQYFLDRLYMSRISNRMLINQHVLFSESVAKEGESQLVGAIDPECDIMDVVNQAYSNARFICEQYYLNAPEMITKTIDASKSSSIRVVYVPSHLYHIMFELIKNAMRATVEHGENNHSYELPPLELTIVLSKEDLVIKLSDKGGGIPRRLREKIFQYLYTTAPEPAITTSGEQNVEGAPLAGYGYGLPLSRLYARYFAGDLDIYSADGYGTDALVYLRAKSQQALEDLPIYHEVGSKKIYEAQLTASDWTVERT